VKEELQNNETESEIEAILLKIVKPHKLSN